MVPPTRVVRSTGAELSFRHYALAFRASLKISFSLVPGSRTVSELDELLAAAREVLAQRGYDGLRVEDVLVEAGLSTRAFYRHFAGKDALFLALFEQESMRADLRLRARVDQADGPVEAVREWVTAVLAVVYQPRLAKRARLFAGERGSLARRFPEEIDRLTRRQVEPLEAAIEAGRATGAFPVAQPADDARAIHHLCSGLINDRLYGSTSLSRSDAVALATRFALGALRAPATRSW
jgi:AcrR family transcriptional regulator